MLELSIRGYAGGMGKLLDCVDNIEIYDAHTHNNEFTLEFSEFSMG